MSRLVISSGVFTLTLLVTTVINTVIWQFVGDQLYDCTEESSFGYWHPGDWVHSVSGQAIVTVPAITHARSMSDPDSIKQGWSENRLWHLWFSFVGASVVVSLATAWLAGKYPSPSTSRASRVASLCLLAILVIGCGAGDKPNTPESRATAPASILLFNGSGTSPNDVAAIEKILKNHHAEYATANSRQLDKMGQSEINKFQLLIVPGGDFIEIGNGLTSNATTNIRGAVERGLNYLGICAGAFIGGNSPTNGLNLTSGVKFGFYSAENQGVRKAAVPISVPGGPTLDHYWEDGPQLSGWGEVVGKYPDGAPAIVQGSFGDGWVVLSGIHAEAPGSWRRGMTFATPADVDNEYAWTLIHAALNRAALPHY